MEDNHYEEILKLAVDHATSIAMEDPKILDSEDLFHDTVFGRVLAEIDRGIGVAHLQQHEASEISEICSEVESDVLHGDILGNFKETSGVGWPD